MKFNKFYFEKYRDIYNYHNEIQKINNGYRLYFNKITKQITIVNINNNYEICYVFNSILEIYINNLRFSKINNIENILKYIEDSNEKLEKSNKEKQLNFIKNTSKEFIKLSNRKSNTTIKDINKIIGVTKC